MRDLGDEFNLDEPNLDKGPTKSVNFLFSNFGAQQVTRLAYAV